MSVAHFLLDGAPLCTHSCVAYMDRLAAAGHPPCEDVAPKQCERFAALAAQFPGRVTLVVGRACPDYTP